MKEKICIFTFDQNGINNLYKFCGCLINTQYEDLLKAKNYLYENGIEIKKPSQMKICTFSLDTLKKRIKYSNNNDYILQIKSNPLLLINETNFNKNNKVITLNGLMVILKKIMLKLNLDMEANLPILSERLERLYDNDYLYNHTEKELYMDIFINQKSYPKNVVEEVSNAINKILEEKI
jgi:hypothetical protein